MTRVRLDDGSPELTDVESLDTLVPQYAENKQLLDDYKKLCDDENKKIKEMLDITGTSSHIAGGYKVVKSTQNRQSMNEDKLLEVLRKYPFSYDEKLIKTREYIDMDELERAIYNGMLSQEVLMEIDKCRESKEVVTLRLTKVKETDNGGRV